LSTASASTTRPVAVGVVGCGNISDIYLKNLTAAPAVTVVACADLVLDRARSQAAAYGVPRACTVDELLADPAVELVLDLTIPAAHAEVALRAVEAGKSVYNEKPLAIARADARRLLDRAGEMGVRVGGAPDTFLGAGLQTCRRLIDEGAIGTPVAFTAAMLSHGPEGWHPDPAFFYLKGAGLLFDMGPYYLTALVTLLGPVARVSAGARASFPTRRVTSEPGPVRDVPVETPTHVAAVLEMASGPVGTLTTTFDVYADRSDILEIAGSDGTLRLPDPNTFGGSIGLLDRERAWNDQTLDPGSAENSRGLGVVDLAEAIRTGRPARASGELAYHVLDVMHVILESAEFGRRIDLESTVARPDSL